MYRGGESLQLSNPSRKTVSTSTGFKKSQKKKPQSEKLTANYYPESHRFVYKSVGPREVTGNQSIMQRNHRQLTKQGRWAKSLAVHQLIDFPFNYGRPLSGCSKKLQRKPNRHEGQLRLKREHLLPLKSHPRAC